MSRDAFDDADKAAIYECLQEWADCGELDATPLPSPELIWWRARLAEKRRLAQRSVLAIEAVRTAAVFAAALFMILSIALWAPRLFGNLPLPLPLTVTALSIFGCSTGGILYAWDRRR
jgi:hypothetical protein